MTDVYGSPKKRALRKRLFQIGVETLEKEGWTVTKIPGFGKASARWMTRGEEHRIVAIRTTQDTWLSFPRDKTDSHWVTLANVDRVLVVSVDDPAIPKLARVHLLDADDVTERFDRAYKARLEAGHTIPIGRGVWIPLYLPDAVEPPTHVGGGAGLEHPPIATVPIGLQASSVSTDGDGAEEVEEVEDLEDVEDGQEEDAGVVGTVANAPAAGGGPLTIREAKRRLALTFGVDPQNITITIEA